MSHTIKGYEAFGTLYVNWGASDPAVSNHRIIVAMVASPGRRGQELAGTQSWLVVWGWKVVCRAKAAGTIEPAISNDVLPSFCLRRGSVLCRTQSQSVSLSRVTMTHQYELLFATRVCTLP